MHYQPVLRSLLLIPSIKPTDVVVFIAVADHLNKVGKCWPGIDKIALLTQLNRRTVQRSLRKMEKLNAIKTFPSHRRSSTYEIGEALKPYLIFKR